MQEEAVNENQPSGATALQLALERERVAWERERLEFDARLREKEQLLAQRQEEIARLRDQLVKAQASVAAATPQAELDASAARSVDLLLICMPNQLPMSSCALLAKF